MTTDRPRLSLSVRVRITAAVAALVLLALTGAGVIVYAIESRRLNDAMHRAVDQELDEFVRLQQSHPDLGLEPVLREFLLRNVPDDDELLVIWSGDRPIGHFPKDELVKDPTFDRIAQRLVVNGGTASMDTAKGEVQISSQPVQQAGDRGALLVVIYLDEERGELRATMRTYAVIAAISALLVTAAAGGLAGRLLRPLRTLRMTTEEISASDLSRRIPDHGVTQRRDDIAALTRTVNGMLDRLEASFVGQRQFLDDAGHELRTPLTILRGHLELMDAGDAHEVGQTRALLMDEIDRMARLVGDLTLLAKSDRPDFLRPDSTDVADLVATVLAKATALGQRSWRADPPPSPAGTVLELDSQRLTQALLQLADNAVKHTEPGAEIGIGAELDGSVLRCWVRDTGHGIPAAERDHIFDRFGRSSVPAGDEGFGLGLSIVKAIAVAHGGRAYAADPPARFGRSGGAYVVIEIPAVRRSSGLENDRVDPQSTEELLWPES